MAIFLLKCIFLLYALVDLTNLQLLINVRNQACKQFIVVI